MHCTRCDLPVFEDDQGLYSQFPVTHPEMPGFTFMDRAHECGNPPAPHKAPASAHVRETATPSEFLAADELAEVFAQTGVTPGPVIVGECWCGAVYAVPQGDDEYGALEAAQAKHVQEVA